ncbi:MULTISPECIES: conjugal transfer protein [unclassified Leeuwenhoekiella]|uniref:conjugal transfer protein n=1 Tax=unclassified Leeuwenhoekiella TaxID=2615029 RepID=UPI000C4C5252|nr:MULTISPECIES: conjugal transfer protein [unclassified Leeuwenhoekiella]MAW94327.1 conjugal transfer protein [Leeuwenhoekiella sp.]MBA83008.1 conjugal transfer protein [Leeuwenhoekiella sp.]|tara:strand:- start:587 stop:1186 length:600 start_codon:yes stop_codon:yes gene_type:complete
MKTHVTHQIKKLGLVIALITALLTPGRGTAQGMPVYDNTNFVSLVKSLLESAKQTSQLLKTVEFLKQQKENLEKVNNVVKQLKAVKEIGKNNARLIQVMRQDLREILNSPYIKPDEVLKITDAFNELVDNSLEAMDFIDQILSSNYLKMSDADRAAILKEKEAESKEMVATINLKTKRYKEIIAFRKLQDRINNRETGY